MESKICRASARAAGIGVSREHGEVRSPERGRRRGGLAALFVFSLALGSGCGPCPVGDICGSPGGGGASGGAGKGGSGGQAGDTGGGQTGGGGGGTDTARKSHVVVLHGGVPEDVAQAVGVTPTYVYTSALLGFAADLSKDEVAALLALSDVDYIEEDRPMGIVTTTQILPGGQPWGLDRIDQASLPLSGTYSYDADGTGVTAYVIDTGVDPSHPDFGGRASVAYDAFGQNGLDCHGHGTHVAGTLGAATYGVAKNVQIRGVRVLGCSGGGTVASVLAGINWVAANAVHPAVANLSLGGPSSLALNTATNNLAGAGVFVAAAAGNYNADACNFSPASAPLAFTVAATDSNDARATYSNHGPCVDIHAPGTGILSTWLGGGVATLPGTSMASPHVAGCAALFKQMNGDVPTAAISAWLSENATPNVVQGNVAGTPNRLLRCAKPDVIIRDHSGDTGMEPDPGLGQIWWESPAIWNRVQNDNGTVHQNPEYGQTNYAHVRLDNRGSVPATGDVNIHFRNSNIGVTWGLPQWPLVGTVGPVTVPPLTQVDVVIPWMPAVPNVHECMVALWDSSQEPMTYPLGTDTEANARDNNNVAQRNMNVVNLVLPKKGDVIFQVANPVPVKWTGRLRIVAAPGAAGETFAAKGTLTVDLGATLFDRWKQAGGKGKGIQPLSGTVLQITNMDDASIEGLELSAGEIFDVVATFGKNDGAYASEPYLVRFMQYEASADKPIGGVSYEVRLPDM